ncbi:MAG: hypothetical protein HY567_04630 [Candidatus Kerfeldbacteria bacterium]|nr:hypothetical protein [Candidatus Kerfeldbacteria bacterium]
MKKTRILRLLRQFGFTPAQARLYLAGVMLGPALMAVLSKEAGLPRSTAYYLMSELKRRGFFTSRMIGRRTYYAAASGQRLLLMTKRRELLIRRMLPILHTIQQNRFGRS